MVCNGVLPIDQLREFTGPAGLIALRVPKEVLDGTYGFHIRTRNADGEHEDRQPTADEFLKAYAGEFFVALRVEGQVLIVCGSFKRVYKG